MSVTANQLYDGLYRLGNEDRIDRLFPSVVAKLIEFGIVEKGSDPPLLTAKGRKYYRIMESRDDEGIPELDDLAFQEFEQADAKT